MKIARIVAVVLTIASIAVVARLRLSRDLTELFPKTAEAHALARVTKAFGGGDVALVLLEGDDEAELATAADEAATAIGSLPSVEHVVARLPSPNAEEAPDPTGAWRWADPKARDELAAAVTDEGMRARLKETHALLLAPGAGDVSDLLTRDPLRLAAIPWEGHLELAAGAHARAGDPFVAEDGRARLLVVEPRGRAFDGDAAKTFTSEVGGALDRVRAAHPKATIALTGGHVIAAETEAMMRSDLTKSSVLSLVLASVVFVVTFRRARALVAVLPPLAAGTIWTTAFAALAYPRLSAIATAFCAVVIGVGVDTGVHVYGRLLAARRQGHAPDEAGRIALRETWRPTLGAAVAAGAAFACLSLSDIEGMRQLGVLCALGEVLTALAILAFVPLAGARLERGDPPKERAMPLFARLTSTPARALVALSAAFACVAIALAVGLPKLDHGVVTLDATSLPAMGTYEKIYRAFGGTRGQLVVVSTGDDEEAARAHADAVAEVASTLAAGGSIVGYDALATAAPSEALQRMRLAERDHLDLPDRRDALERALKEEGFAIDAFAPALEAFEHPTTATAKSPIERDEGMARWIFRRHLAHDEGGWLAVTYVRLKGGDDDAIARAAIRAADPEAILTGYADLERSLRESLGRDLPRVMAAAFGMVLFVLAFSLRKPSAVALAISVLVVEIALVLLLARVTAVRWHVYDALVLPVLLGITLDEALFLLDAADHRGIDEAVAEQAPLATATALTTAAGFGALLVCRFGGLVDIGKVGALGSIAGLLAALVLVPAGHRALRLRRRRKAS